MITESGQTDHGVDVFCLACGDRLLEKRLDRSLVYGDGCGWWVICSECRGAIRPDFYQYQTQRSVRILRSFGWDVELRIDGEER